MRLISFLWSNMPHDLRSFKSSTWTDKIIIGQVKHFWPDSFLEHAHLYFCCVKHCQFNHLENLPRIGWKRSLYPSFPPIRSYLTNVYTVKVPEKQNLSRWITKAFDKIVKNLISSQIIFILGIICILNQIWMKDANTCSKMFINHIYLTFRDNLFLVYNRWHLKSSDI